MNTCSSHVLPRKKISFYVHLTLSLILSFQDGQTEGVKFSVQLGSLHLYIEHAVSDSLLLMFYSEQRYITLKGNATNWNGTGFEEIFNPTSKFRVKFWRNASWCLLNNVTMHDHISFCINPSYCGDKQTYLELHWSLQTRLINVININLIWQASWSSDQLL
jgi:hypothetical protein